VELSKFRGVDLTSSVVNVDLRRSPDAPNMIPDADGFPAKRPGWHTLARLDGQVNGAYSLQKEGKEHELVHAGTKLYEMLLDTDELPEGGVLDGAVIRHERARQIATHGKAGCVKNVTVYGKTTQSGTGDSSPSNIREIHGVGRCDKYFVIDGNTGFDISDDLGSVLRCATLSYPCPDVKYSNSPATVDTFSSYIKMVSGYMIDSEHYYLTPSTCYFFVLKSKLSANTLAGVQEFFANNPLTVWYKSTAFEAATQVYCGIEVEDETGYHEYVGKSGQPLFDGDTLETNVLSGGEYKQREYRTKKKITFDGSESWASVLWGPPDYTWGNIDHARFQLILEQPPVFNTAPICNCFQGYIYSNIAGEGVMIGGSPNINVVIRKDRLSTVDAPGFKTWLASNNITIVYDLATPVEILTEPVKMEQEAGKFTLTAEGEIAAELFAAKEICSEMADARSKAVQLKEKLWILDGTTYRCYDAEKVRPVSEIATVPMITVAKAPNGQYGATSNLPPNLLTGKRTDSYAGLAATASETVYYLSYNDLSAEKVKAEILNAAGDWVAKSEGTDFTVDRTLGKITFNTAPGKSPVEGEDNVHITYEVKASHADQINHCRHAILYGVKGAMDRVFMAGSSEEPNVDYWSQWNDPTYFGDTWYGMLGQESSPIVGYSVLADTLVTHKYAEENGRNAFVRKGTLDDDGFAVFPISNVIQGEGAVCPDAFESLSSEPVFLTRRGVYALTPSDITGERYAQERSFFISAALENEDLSGCCAVCWGRFYVLACKDRLYLLDSAQKSYEGKTPYSNYQYECYYWENIGARSLWVRENTLYFGTKSGEVRAFWQDKLTSHANDDGAAIKARWTTPLMNFGFWDRLKLISGVWVVGQPYTRSGGNIYYATDREYAKQARGYKVDIFNWDDIDFNRWTFNTLDRPNVVPARKKANRVKLFQVRVENEEPNELFGLTAIQVNYKRGGLVK
jgi:hypothetical protein